MTGPSLGLPVSVRCDPPRPELGATVLPTRVALPAQALAALDATRLPGCVRSNSAATGLAPALWRPIRLRCGLAPPSLAATRVAAVVCLVESEAPPLAATVLDPICRPVLDPSDVEAVLQAALPAPSAGLSLTAALRARVIEDATLVAALPAPTAGLTLGAALVVELDLALPAATGPSAEAPARDQRAIARGWRLIGTEMRATRHAAALDHRQARAGPGPALGLRHSETRRLRRVADTPHAEARPIRAARTAPHADTRRLRRATRALHTEAVPIQAAARAGHRDRERTRDRLRLDQQDARPIGVRLDAGHHVAQPVETALGAPHTAALWPLPGRWTPCYMPAVLLRTRASCGATPPLGTDVELPGCCDGRPRPPWVPEPPTATRIVPIRRLYIVRNTVTLTLLDGTEIPAESLRLALEADAWAWSWSARVPGAALARLQAEPEAPAVELIATVNAHPIRLRLDSIARARTFGSNWLDLGGRGRAAVLGAPTAAPRARTNTESRSARQLLDAALTDNGMPIGWTLDWQLEDWTVPAGAWSHTGTFIEAAARIAEAGGGYVQGHDTEPVLRLLPWYPRPPWAWAETTPDIALPENACHTERIEWIARPDYDAVWITGGEGGRRDRVRRAGRAGDTQAPTCVDALATDVVMTRQRGLRLLADTGRQAHITLRAPVHPETGIIHPGQLIAYTEGGTTRLGLSRAVELDCRLPEVWQSIRIESHPT
ncbi:hypothetical protein L0E83_11375 [Marichromatium gracile]|uniref:hypothetical protein n=1 Tax=Marichromatium gracile TaxID=1048 RepID=UPI001F177E9E|nr:hypothetical protein [Marichromatium gracile]MCF1184031.1 hypothetical protein [Marichromatium gracile]